MHLSARRLAGTAALLLLGSCTVSPPSAIPSPDRTLTLLTSVNLTKDVPAEYLCVRFRIVDSTGKVLHEQQTRASDRMRWSIRWDGNDRVVLDSADVGTTAWKKQPDGSWREVP